MDPHSCTSYSSQTEALGRQSTGETEPFLAKTCVITTHVMTSLLNVFTDSRVLQAFGHQPEEPQLRLAR